MKETFEFRVDEEFCGLLFKSTEGRKVGTSTRVVSLDSMDPRLGRVGKLQKSIREIHGKPFFYGWTIRRRYSVEELGQAQLFLADVTHRFEPTGEECGTTYDERIACAECGAGAKQTGPLILNIRSIPKKVDIAKTISGEMVVSKRLMDLATSNAVTGIDFNPVHDARDPRVTNHKWFQLNVQTVARLDVSPKTKVGNDPFDEDPLGKYKCPRGDLIGLNLLTQTWVRRSEFQGIGVFESRQFMGCRRGLLRPERLLFLTSSARKLFLECGIKGIKYEVVGVDK